MDESVAPASLVAVISRWEEPPYGGDHLSSPRSAFSFTLHEGTAKAEEHLAVEAALCLTPLARSVRRRCGLAAVLVPDRLLAGAPAQDIAHRWCSDRLPELARRAGLDALPDPRGAAEMAFARPAPHLFLLAALEAALAEGSDGRVSAAADFLISLAALPPERTAPLRRAALSLLPPDPA